MPFLSTMKLEDRGQAFAGGRTQNHLGRSTRRDTGLSKLVSLLLTPMRTL